MGKKGNGRRLSKKQLADALQGFFQASPNETFSLKQIFRALKLVTHPAKMLAIETMEEMAWDDYLLKVSDNEYRLNLKGQVQEGTFCARPTARTLSFLMEEEPLFLSPNAILCLR